MPWRAFRSLVALWLSILIGPAACAGDLDSPRIRVLPARALHGPHDHAREVVPIRPDFVLWDGQKYARPPRVNSRFQVLREQADLALVREDSGHHVEGWAAKRDLVPIDQAEAYFSGRIQAEPRDPFPRLMRAEVRFHFEQNEAGRSDLEEVLRLDPRCTAALEWRAYLSMRTGRNAEALADIDRAIQIDPNDARLLVARSLFRMRFRKEKPEATLADLDAAARLAPRDPQILLTRATVEMGQRNHRQSVEDIRKATEIAEDDTEVFVNAVMFLVIEGRYREARALLSERMRSRPDPDLEYAAHLISAMIEIHRWQYPIAMRELRKAIALNPNKEDAFLLRSLIHHKMPFSGRLVMADMDAALRADPRSIQALLSRSYFHEELREYAEARADLETAARVKPQDAGIQVRLAWMLATCPDARVRDGRAAFAAAMRACALSEGSNPEPLHVLAAAQAEIGDFTAAVSTEAKAIARLKKDAFDMGHYKWALDRYKKGKPAYRLGLLVEWGIRTAERSSQ